MSIVIKAHANDAWVEYDIGWVEGHPDINRTGSRRSMSTQYCWNKLNSEETCAGPFDTIEEAKDDILGSFYATEDGSVEIRKTKTVVADELVEATTVADIRKWAELTYADPIGGPIRPGERGWIKK